MRILCSLGAWLVLSLLWTLGVAAAGFSAWPQIPLDVSTTDPGTLEAFRKAEFAHALRFGLLAAVPPAIALIAHRFVCPGRRTGT